MGKYDHIIAWGTGPIFQMSYRSDYFSLEFVIDGTGDRKGQCIHGVSVRDESDLDNLEGKILIVIYAIYEYEIIEQINKHSIPDVDTVIFPLLDVPLGAVSVTQMNAKNCEDFLALMVVRQLGIENLRYLEIGVCHPVMRNNTWLLREQFRHLPGYQGVLVEANPLCWDIIEEYRPDDQLCKLGVAPDGGVTRFYAFPGFLGHSTFVRELAEEIIASGKECRQYEVNTENINTIIEKNFVEMPDLLSIDAEGLDYKILESLNTDKYPFKIIISEAMCTTDEPIRKLMEKRGFCEYARTPENVIWIRKDYKIFI